MAAAASSIVFDDIFTTNDIDKEGRKFDRVSRLYAHSKNYDMDLTLDYNIELFRLQKEESFALALSSSLARGGAPTTNAADGADDAADDKERDVWRPDGKGRRGLEDDYDYVMYGKVYKFDGGTTEIVYVLVQLFQVLDFLMQDSTAYASFGGLLMSLTGSFRHMTSIVLGDPVYLLLRK
ncbi:hypothetical protein DXG03_007870 [Asterophora parasitica]|uniref:Uncharacterized protein n=1 Tax=Asterophora parasitica TaxID=117018 RepID=A0A9P7KAL8_9AGAR|nr:hypothetical protein DXG03_007870 [Asterophora parasitica]